MTPRTKPPTGSSWNEYRLLVMSDLERLNTGVEELDAKIERVEDAVTALAGVPSAIAELRAKVDQSLGDAARDRLDIRSKNLQNEKDISEIQHSSIGLWFRKHPRYAVIAVLVLIAWGVHVAFGIPLDWVVKYLGF